MAEKIHKRDPHNQDAGLYLLGGSIAFALLVVSVIGVSAKLGTSLADLDQVVSVNPMDSGLKVMTGKLVWTMQATVVAIILGLLVLALCSAAGWLLAAGCWRASVPACQRARQTPAVLATLKDIRDAKLDEASARKEGRFLRPPLASVSDKDIESAELAVRLGFLHNSKHPRLPRSGTKSARQLRKARRNCAC